MDEDQNGHDQLLLIVNDISSRKEAELEIRKQKYILQTILDGTTDIIALQQPDHTVISYNKAGYEAWGQPPDQIVGRKCYELLGRNAECELCAYPGPW